MNYLQGNWFDSSYPESIMTEYIHIDEYINDPRIRVNNAGIVYYVDEDDHICYPELIQDSDGDYYFEIKTKDDVERAYILLEWNEVYKSQCNCTKTIDIIDKKTSEFYNNQTAYCMKCGWKEGIIRDEKLENADDIKSAIEDGYKVSEKNLKLLNDIYPDHLF